MPAAIAAAAILAPSVTVHAEPRPLAPTAVGIAFPACQREPFSFDAAMAAMRIELGHEGVRRVDRLATPGAGADAWIEISSECSSDLTSLSVRIHDPRARDISRTMELFDLPPALRPRGLALVVAELARASWTRPPTTAETDATRTQPQPAAAPADAPPPELRLDARPAGPEPTTAESPPVADSAAGRPTSGRPGTSLALGLGVRLFVPDATLLEGARLAGRFGRMRAGLDGMFGIRRDDLGDVTFITASGWLGVDVLRLEQQSWRFRTGPRISAGLAAAAAHAHGDARSKHAENPYIDAAIEAGTEVRLGQSYWGFLDFEAGLARGLEVYADDRRSGKVGGFLLGGHLGVGVSP
jgi:hypothetical protein